MLCYKLRAICNELARRTGSVLLRALPCWQLVRALAALPISSRAPPARLPRHNGNSTITWARPGTARTSGGRSAAASRAPCPTVSSSAQRGAGLSRSGLVGGSAGRRQHGLAQQQQGQALSSYPAAVCSTRAACRSVLSLWAIMQ